MSVAHWVGEVVQAVQSSNTSKLLACLNARNELAQACLHRAQFTPAQLQQIAHGKFQSARVKEAEKWATVTAEHLLALQLCLQNKYLEAVERYVAASESLRKIFANVPSESTWLDDVVVDFIKSVVQVARRAAKGGAEGATSALRRAGDEMRTLRKDAFQHRKVAVLLALTVQIYKLYFSMSAVFLMKDLHLQLEGFESELKLCPVGDLCSYKFFRGMLELLEERWAAAEANLALAFAICDPRHQCNLGKILSYLVPVQILRGAMPRREMLRKYGLSYFEPIVAALKKGDPVELEVALDAEQTRFIRRGIYLAMGKLHVLCFRTLLKRVHECQLEAGGHATQLRLDAVTACCTSLGMDVDEVEVQCMVNTLIARKLVKGYVALPQQILVVQKGGPKAAFPAVGGASWG